MTYRTCNSGEQVCYRTRNSYERAQKTVAHNRMCSYHYKILT